MFSKIRPLLLLFIAGSMFGKAQNFNYSLVKDSSSYTCLAGCQTVCAEQNFMSRRFSVHLPFSFNFCGSTTDSVIIEGNGFISFNEQRGWSLVAFNNFTSRTDTSHNYSSSISSLITGTEGNRILKIQFSHLAQYALSANDFLDYQVWLYENGSKIEFHIGANSFSGYGDLPQLLGIINRKMDTENKAFLISGNISSPGTQLISGDDPFVYLNSIPSQGIIYKLSPSF